ncbi:MAG: GntR family transcriptional regulator [Microbacteriaceae bacterium]|jgi:DNA-binding GntR family transcriptional regulator|nr:GntR family transcriptional regulator [Microbacteriaceae bacterium]
MATGNREDAQGLSAATPPRTREGRTVIEVRDQIRSAIIAGDLAPGAPLSSEKLSATYGVSRTPIREALRLLQEEGFVTVASNQRPRVATWSSDELEAVFVQRILLTAICTSLTIPRLSTIELDEIRTILETLTRAEEEGDHDAWRRADIRFHAAHTALAPAALLADLQKLNARALMFRYMWLGQRSSTMTLSFDDHDTIYEACVAGDAYGAANAVAHHLATVGITLLARVDPAREPTAVREALRYVGASSTTLPL